MAISYEEVLELANQLSKEEQIRLTAQLRVQNLTSPRVTREQLLSEYRSKPKGTLKELSPIKLDVEVSAEELEAYLHEVATEWKRN